jgi:hypothetical protein
VLVVKMSEARTRQEAVDRNHAAFGRKLPELLEKHRGKYALLRHEEIVGFYESIVDAQQIGEQLYPDGLFSVQQVTDNQVDLGFYSHAVHLGAA